MICIPKTSTVEKREEYRTLSLVSYASMILTRLIYHQMEKKTEKFALEILIRRSIWFLEKLGNMRIYIIAVNNYGENSEI